MFQFLGYDNCPFQTHLTLDDHVGTLLRAYVSFEMCLALTMIYFIVKMPLTPHVPFETLAMAYIFIKMHMAFHVRFRTLTMVYILIKNCLAFYGLFRILTMVYIFVKIHLAFHVPFRTLAMACIFVKMRWPFMSFLKPWLWLMIFSKYT